MGWFFSFGTNSSMLSCNNVGCCHFYRRLLTCIPSLRAPDIACPRHRSCAIAPVRWVVGSQRSRKTVAMFSKQGQRTWIKIQCARGRTAKQCRRGLKEACDPAALPYRTVGRWVAAFRDGRERVEHMLRSGYQPVSDENVQLVSIPFPEGKPLIRRTIVRFCKTIS